MKKIETKYYADVENQGVYQIFFPDLERAAETIKKGNILACVTYDGDSWHDHSTCELYFNEAGYNKKDLLKSGYSIVKNIKKIDYYCEEEIVLGANSN